MREIRVAVPDRPYVVHIERGASASLGRLLAPLGRSRLAVVSSPTIWEKHRDRIRPGLADLAWTEVLVADGERQKNARTLERLYDAFVTARLGRDGLVVAIGGGVIGDVAGFAAATYMRGVDWVGVPTTLLAMVDSSVGGKVGINHPRAKNMIGAFHQPRAVIVDPAFLGTLPARQRQTGAYEVLKCGIIGDRGLFDALPFEAVTEYRRFTHGEAVGWGLIAAAALARRRGLLSAPDFEEIASAVDGLGPRPRLGLAPERVLDAVARDKKAREGRVPFILPTAIGAVTIVPDVTTGEILAVLDELAQRRAPARRRG